MRTLRLLLAGVLVVVLAACGGADRGSASNGETASDDDSATPVDDDSSGDNDDASTNDDDDDNDNDDGANENPGLHVIDGLLPSIERIDGGEIGFNGVSIAARGDLLAIAACRGLELVVMVRDGDRRWRQEVVYDHAASPSIAIDADGRLHTAFVGVRDQVVRHAVREADGAWRIEPVEHPTDEDRLRGGTGLALDAAGVAHVCYAGHGSLFYADNLGGAWRAENVDSDHYIETCALAVGADGVVHIAPDNQSYERSVLYFHGSFGVWTFERLIARSMTGSGITLDAAGEPHLFFVSADAGSAYGFVQHAWREAGDWQWETVAATPAWSGAPAAMTDLAGRLTVAFFDDDAAALAAAVQEGGQWQETHLQDGYFSRDRSDDYVSFTWNVAGAIDHNGAFHWAANDPQRGLLFHATDEGGEWISEVAAEAHNEGGSLDAAVDPIGAVHVVYVDFDQAAVKYATNAGGEWAIDTIRQSVDGAFPMLAYYQPAVSLALDALGAAHVAIIDHAANEVLYATNALGEWSEETLWRGKPAMGVALAVDSLGRPSVAFFAYSSAPNSFEIAAMQRANEQWETSTAALPNQPFVEPADLTLVVDPADQPQILASILAYDHTGFWIEYYLTLYELRPGGLQETDLGTGYGSRAAYDSQGRLQRAWTWHQTSGSYPFYVQEAHTVYALGLDGEQQQLDQRGEDEPLALAIDSQDRPALAYWTDGVGLQRVTKRDGAWSATLIEPECLQYVSPLGFPAAVGVDAAGRAHVVYYAGYGLYYAVVP